LSSFAWLEQLRYLNISENAFEVLPEVVALTAAALIRTGEPFRQSFYWDIDYTQ
jgi:hypothetical protein